MYRVTRVLGKGTFGIVYLLEVHDARGMDMFALKKDSNRMNTDDPLKEAKIMSRLCHPHIVQCYDYFMKSSMVYLVTEFCEGGNLDAYIKNTKEQEQRVSEKTVLSMLCQLADVLRYLYAEHIIHRDLKPANILLDENGNIKVADVGIARELDFTSQGVMTYAGTPFYMSPEVYHRKMYTSKADIYSLGCCIYELMVLERVFNTLADLGRKKRRIPRMPTNIYSSELCHLVKDMLGNQPEERLDGNKIFCKACILRGKPYQASTAPTVEVKNLSQTKILSAVAKFEESDDESDDSDLSEFSESTLRAVSSVIPLEKKGAAARSVEGEHFENRLKKDTFGTFPNRRVAHGKKKPYIPGRSSSKEQDSFPSSESVVSELGESTLQAYIDSDSLADLIDSTHREAPFPGKHSSSHRMHDRHAEATYDVDDVTLYTRAQKAKYKRSRSKQETGTLEMLDMEKAAENVFKEQNEEFKQLLVKRVMGHTPHYTLDGQPMLHHRPF